MDEIKTEVDRLIELLKSSATKPVRLSELAMLAGLSVPQARKWIHILEERRQVRVSYNLAEEQVQWTGGAPPKSAHVRSPPPSFPTTLPPESGSAADLNVEMARYNEQRYRQMHGISRPAPEERENAGLETVSMKPAQAREAGAEGPITETGASAGAGASLGAVSSPARRPSHIYPTAPSGGSPPDKPDEEPEEPELPRFESALPPLPKMDEKALRMGQALKGKISQARAKREQIEKLKAEKKRLLVEVYRPLETRIEQEAGAITEKLIELENHLLTVREQAAQVPHEVADLAGEQERIVQVAGEMHRLYSETDQQMTRSLNALNGAHADAQQRLEQAHRILDAQQAQVDELGRHADELENLRQRTEEHVRAAQEALAEQQARIDGGRESLRELEQMRDQLSQRMDDGRKEMGRQRALLGEIEHQLGRIDEVQHWVQEHRVEYGQRMQRLEQYAKNAGTEYHKLKAAIDSGYVHRYLRDLRALSDSYEFELAQAQRTETDIDQRLEQAKKELAILIGQAREVADTQEMRLSQAPPSEEEMQGHSDAMDKATADLMGASADLEAEGPKRRRLRENVRRAMAGEDEPEEQAVQPDAPVSVVIEPPERGAAQEKKRRGRPKKGE
ncbi:Chromosome partition protein Smc [uncultured archaeon]|nr:Chromosome partition protein Smc [uncultured archaeon]